MSRVTIASVVEGDGEVKALPVLLRRIGQDLGCYDLNIPTPHRLPRGRMVMLGGLENAVGAQAHRVTGRGGILVLLDADDDCPVEIGARLRERAYAARPDVPVAVVVANREFEAWFLASARSIAGSRNLSADLQPPSDPESIRDAKGWLSKRIAGHPYRATTDQAALAAVFDMTAARKVSRSFDKFWRDVEGLMNGPAPA